MPNGVTFIPSLSGSRETGDTSSFDLVTSFEFEEFNAIAGLLSFDPSLLAFVGVTLNGGLQPFESIDLENVASGSVGVQGGDFFGSLSGEQTLATFTFNVLNGGSTSVSFTGDPQGFFQRFDLGNPTIVLDVADPEPVTVEPNDAPVANDDTASTNEETPTFIDVLANDEDDDVGDSLTIDDFTDGENGTVTEDDGGLLYTPDADFSGEDSFTYTVVDEAGAGSTATVTVTVDNENDDPVAADDAVSTDEDAPVEIDVLGNDTDVDNDTLVIASFGQGTNGSVTANAGGLTYTPDADFSGTDTFTYTVEDGNGGSDEATVTVTVDPVLDGTVELVLAEGSDLVPGGTLFFDVITPADFPGFAAFSAGLSYDADVLTFVGAEFNEAFGLQQVDLEPAGSTGVITFSPALQGVIFDPFADQLEGQVTVVTLEFDVIGSGATDVVLTDFGGMFLNFDGDVVFADPIETSVVLNTPPTAVDDGATVDEDGSVEIGVLANDSDDDGDEFDIASFSQGDNGTVTETAGGLTYTPNANFNGVDSFTYTISDGLNSTEATVNVTVTAVPDDPDAIDDFATIDEDGQASINVLANDLEVDGESLSFFEIGAASNGTVEDAGDGVLVYKPNANFNGVDSFSYTVEDESGATDTATVSITVNSVEDTPDAVDDVADVDEDGSV